MKRLIIVLALVISGCASHKKTRPFPPLIDTEPQLSVTVHLCLPDQESPECTARMAQLNRKKHAKELIEILQKDFPNTARVDKSARDHEAAVELWLANHKYD